MIQKQLHSLLNKASEACTLIQAHVKSKNVIRIISHNDADGLTSACILANAIKESGGRFHITIVPRLQNKFIKKLHKERYKLFIFSDVGSGNISEIKRLKADIIIADHHQIQDENIKFESDDERQLIHVNPHLFGIDGTKEVSASGVCYLTIRDYKYTWLTSLALVGAYGDMQFKHGPQSVNKFIIDEGVEHNDLIVEDDLKLSYSHTQPLNKSLTYTYNPNIKGLSGNQDASTKFLEENNIPTDKKLKDLTTEEYNQLKEKLIEINPDIYGKVYKINNIIPELENIEEYSKILDSCGKNKEYTLGLNIGLGKYEHLDQSLELLDKYNSEMQKGIEWIKKEGSIEYDNLQYIFTNDKKRKKVLGAISSIGLDLNIINKDKPVINMMQMDNIIKISSRATDEQVNKGINLGKIMNEASQSFNGTGGGHNIAAGATIPTKEKENFLHLVDEMIEYQIKNHS